MWTSDEIKIISKSANDFVFFTNNIFSKSSKHFIGGQYIDDSCNFLSKNKNTICVSARNHAKCVPFYTPIIMATGDEQKVSLLEKGDIVKTQNGQNKIEHIWHTGEKECYRLFFKSGNTLDCSKEHRILTKNGYKTAEDLQIGEEIAQVSELNIEGHKQLSNDEIKFLAYMIAEGCMSQHRGTPVFTNFDENIVKDFLKTCDNIGFVVKEYAKGTFGVQKSNLFFKKFGLSGKNSYNKFIPYQIMSSPLYQIKKFISVLWDCDGTVSTNHLKKNTGIAYSSSSKELLRQLKILLLRFKIQSNVYSYKVKCNNKEFETGVLTISGAESASIFCKTFTLTEKKQIKLKYVLETFSKKNIKKTEKIRWIKLKNKKNIGYIDCYDFEVEGEHNYLINGIVVHNSYLFYSYIMWKLMFEGSSENMENHYFSFNNDLAGYHIGKIKKCIDDNIYFRDIVDAKSTAESIIKYSWDRRHFFTLTPHGLNGFSRGTHTTGLIMVDDPLADPDNELNLATIYKINETMRSNILDMPVGEGELHIAGTAQSNDDFFFDPIFTKRFAVTIKPAIYQDENGNDRALWPQWMDLEELRLKEIERTPRVFSREYMCTPMLSTKSFFDKQYIINNCVNNNLTLNSPYKKRVTSNLVVGGYDLGKREDPAHFVVYEVIGNVLVMIHQKFMDSWNYSNGKVFDINNPTQLEYIKLCIANMGINTIHYDATRGELDALDEQGMIPNQMIPVIFSNKTKLSMATCLDKAVSRKQIIFCDDDRFLNQLCAVNADLQAMRTKEGHGDSFWTSSLALMGAPDVIGMEDEGVSGLLRKRIKTGCLGVFDTDKIPQGF